MSAHFLISAISFIVFLFLDFLDAVLCLFFAVIDSYIEGHWSPCYCQSWGGGREPSASDDRESRASETLHRRQNIFRDIFRDMGLFGFLRKCEKDSPIRQDWSAKNRWSDCGCASCVSSMASVDQRLHVVVREPSKDNPEDYNKKPTENVIFLHGFVSSSSFWTETVFPNLSELSKHNYRLFAVDLLGFGRSPKPRDCLYTLKDHLEMIENSVTRPFQLNSFHLVAHSMGCIIALALATKYQTSVRSITLLAPPFFIPSKENPSLEALRRFAGRKIWPPLQFGSAVMSWYEHLGRCICFFICRNHETWECILRLLTRRRCLHFLIIDLTGHTHHSGWHTMHNVICGGATVMDDYLEALKKSRVKISVIQGSRDPLVPLECGKNIKIKVPDADLSIISGADHLTVVLGREKDFSRHLEHIWTST